MAVFLKRRSLHPIRSPKINFIEYIQSDGGQYIDTGFYPNQDSRVVMDFEVLEGSSSMIAILGCRDAAATAPPKGYDLLIGGSPNNVLRTSYFGGYASVSTTIIGSRLIADKNKNVCIVGTLDLTTEESTGQSDIPLLLFSVNTAGTASTAYNAKGKIYSCQIYDNGVLIRDYKPCTDPDGVACLWDAVNEEYVYNAGTGGFVAGGAV